MMDAFDDHGKLRIALAQREMAEARIRVLEEALREIAEHKRGSEMTHAEYDNCYEEGDRDEIICIARAALSPRDGKTPVAHEGDDLTKNLRRLGEVAFDGGLIARKDTP